MNSLRHTSHGKFVHHHNRGGTSMPNIGVPGLIIILIIALIVFGPSKLPQLGKAVGQTLKEFKNSTKDIVDDVTQEFKLDDKDTDTKKKA